MLDAFKLGAETTFSIVLDLKKPIDLTTFPLLTRFMTLNGVEQRTTKGGKEVIFRTRYALTFLEHSPECQTGKQEEFIATVSYLPLNSDQMSLMAADIREVLETQDILNTNYRLVAQVHHVNSRGRNINILAFAIYMPNHLAAEVYPKVIRDTFGVQTAHSRNLFIRATNVVVVRGTPSYSTRPLHDPLPHFVFEGLDCHLDWEQIVETILEICGYANVTMIVRQRLREQRGMFGHIPRQPSVTVTTRRIETFALVQDRLGSLAVPNSNIPVSASIRPNAFLAPYVHIYKFDTRGAGAIARDPPRNSYLAAATGQITPSTLTVVSSASSLISQEMTISSSSSTSQLSQELTLSVQDQLNDLFNQKLAPIVSDFNSKNSALTAEISSLKSQLSTSSTMFNARLEESTKAARSESSAILQMLSDITANMVRTNPPQSTLPQVSAPSDMPWKTMIREVLSHPSDDYAIEVYEHWFQHTTHLRRPDLLNPIFQHRLNRRSYANGSGTLQALGPNDGGAGSRIFGWSALSNIDHKWLESSAAGFTSAKEFLESKGLSLNSRFPGFGDVEC